MIIIGSKALKFHYPDFPRENKDIDVICDNTIEEHINNRWNLLMLIREDKKIERLKNPILLDLYLNNKSSSLVYISSNHLTTLKASHLMWNIGPWDKHMFDLQFLLKKGNEIDEKLFWELYEYWNQYHGKNKRSDLKMSKDDFFNNAVNYDTMEHDEMHKIINPTPIYIKILKDGCEVELDEEKYNLLSHEEKLDLVREECYIMAFERYKHLDYRIAYNRMLKKFIINHAPKFTLLFILKNYIELQNKPKFNFIKQIENGIQKNQ